MGAFTSKLWRDAVHGSAKERLMALLRAYMVYAGAHTFIKAFRFFAFTIKASHMLKSFPGYSMDITGKDILTNFHRLHDWRMETMQKFPGADMVRTSGPGVELACISEDAVRFILKDEFDKFTKVPAGKFYLMQLVSDFVGGQGVFCLRHGHQPDAIAEHEQWYSQRKTASKLFTKKNFEHIMLDTFLRKSDKLCEVIGKAADAQDKVDGQRLFFAFTMDSIQKIFFSRDVDTVSGDVDKYAQAYDAAHHHMMAFAFRNISVIMASTLFLPFPFGTVNGDHSTNLFLTLFRKLDKDGAAFERNRDYLSKTTYEFVRQARKDTNLENRRDLLSLFLRQGDSLSDKQLHDIILNFIIAGRDTTACTLTWLFFELTQNPEVQEELIKEIDRVLGGRDPTLDELEPQVTPYLNGVLYETLRLHPPVPEDQKECNEDAVFKGVRIPRGTRMSFIPYTMGRDPRRYTDPLVFNPRRWIPFKEPSMFDMPTFQAGPRFCLGKDMARFEAKLVTAKLLQCFRFSLLAGEASKIGYSLLITQSLVNNAEKTSNNLWLVPERRSDRVAAAS